MKRKLAIVLSVLAALPVAFAETTNMTSEMLAMLVEIMPIMLVVMVFKMLAGSFSSQ